MAAGEYYIGRATSVGVAVNADNSGSTFGGTPGAYVYARPKTGSASFTIHGDLVEVDELEVDPLNMEFGGTYATGTFGTYLSYAYLEKFVQLIMGGAISTTGAGPYDHSQALADQLLFGSLIYYNENFKGAKRGATFTDVLATQITITQVAEQVAEFVFNWIASGISLGTPGAAPTVQTLELCSWRHFCPTINNVATHHINNLTLDITVPTSEADFMLACTTPGTLDFLGRGGRRTVAVSADFAHDSTVDTLMADLTAAFTTNTLVWNNAGAGAAEREFAFTGGTWYLEGAEEQNANWGRKKTPLSFKQTGAWDVDTKNALVTIP